MSTVTEDELINASLDALALGKVINDPANAPNPGQANGTVTTRTGVTYNNLSKILSTLSGTLSEFDDVRVFTSVNALRTNDVFDTSLVYILLTDTVQLYRWLADDTTPTNNVKNVVVDSVVANGRYVSLIDPYEPIYVLLMGQSNAVGADPTTTGQVLSANSRVKVWNEITSAWVVPTAGQEPFNPSGANNCGVELCNRFAEETGREVRLFLIADGSRPISDWTGSTGDRTISEANRPKYVELRTAVTDAGAQINETIALECFAWVQGEANGATPLADYAVEFRQLVADMTSEGIIQDDTPIIASQLYMGTDNRGNGASSNSVLANANIYGLTTLGDQRIGVASTRYLNAPIELTEGAQQSRVHFDDASQRALGRFRLYGEYNRIKDGVQYPVDFTLDRVRTDVGNIGLNYFRTAYVGVDFTSGTVLPLDKLGGRVDCQNGTTIILPDLTHPTAYSSAVRNMIGLTCRFILRQSGSFTLSLQSGGTGILQAVGAVATETGSSGAVQTMALTKSNALYEASWEGSRWQVWQLSA